MRRRYLKILVIPESVAARRVRESVVINKYCIIYCHDRSPTETLGDDGKRQQLIQEHSTRKAPGVISLSRGSFTLKTPYGLADTSLSVNSVKSNGPPEPALQFCPLRFSGTMHLDKSSVLAHFKQDQPILETESAEAPGRFEQIYVSLYK